MQICDPLEIRQAHNQNSPQTTDVEIFEKCMSFWFHVISDIPDFDFFYIYKYAQKEGTFLCGVKVASL